MDSMTECGTGELNMKPQVTEEPKDDVVKLNGEMNGSYEEEMEMTEDSEIVSKCASQSNGEVMEIRVPSSHENGVEIMDDKEASSETGNDCEISDFGVNGSGASEIQRTQEEYGMNNHMEEVHTTTISGDEKDEESDTQMDVEEIETDPFAEKEIDDVPKEVQDLRKDSLEITLVRPLQLAQEKQDSGEDEALNMSVNKNEEKDELGSEEVSSSDAQIDSTMKTPEKGDDDDSCVEITPDKSSSKKKKTQPLIIAPRRSSRNLNKTKSYADKDIYIEELDKKSDDEVEEVVPQDPLAGPDDSKKCPKKTTIVVSDTKRLVEIAAGSKQSKTGKKEPTLVIIDTNSILSGKGAVAVSQATLPQMTITPNPSRSTFSMIPLSVPNQTVYPKQLKVTPTQPPVPAVVPAPVQPPKPVILPTLTDDMYVVEAPSFIVPYVYEKPPVTSLRDYVVDLEKNIKEQRAKEDLERKRRKKEKEEKEGEKEEEKQKETTEEGELSEVEKEKVEMEKTEPKEEEKKLEDAEVQEVENKTGENKGLEKEEEKEKEKEVEKDSVTVTVKPEEKPEKSEKPEKTEKEGGAKSDTETDDEFKESEDDAEKKDEELEILAEKTKKKSDSYFDNPLGKFFMQIGVNLVQEFVQTDLLRNQKRKRDRDGKSCSPEVHMAISSLLKTLECSKENNEPFKLEMKKCNLCSFKTESELVMAHHLETPHMRNYVYRCNFCTMEVRSPHDILFHMEAVHNVRGRLERAPAFHQCPNCPFEDNQKGKLSRHLLSCAKKYKPERNQEPPLDWEPPAKIPRVRGSRPALGMTGAMYPLAPRGVHNPMSRMPSPPHGLLPHRGRGRPPISVNRYITDVRAAAHQKALSQMRPGMVFRPSVSNSQPQVLLPAPYQISNNQLFQNKVGGAATAKLLQQPSISITPLPRQSGGAAAPGIPSGSAAQVSQMVKPGRPMGSSKPTFVICEICDGYIKDLEQLRNHMQWIHKVKIHPKMIYNRPPLNCQKCQFRFFTDQGLERHLLGSHGLVTSSMQEAANKGKDGGRCPVCGRVYQWKLLNHVARDHNMSLKPAHLSYKCTVCTATFGMYKQFENHVYSAHSVVAKRVMDKKPPTPQPSTSNSQNSQPKGSSLSSVCLQNESILKPLKINDEITIIPQPARAKTKPVPQQPPKNNKV